MRAPLGPRNLVRLFDEGREVEGTPAIELTLADLSSHPDLTVCRAAQPARHGRSSSSARPLPHSLSDERDLVLSSRLHIAPKRDPAHACPLS